MVNSKIIDIIRPRLKGIISEGESFANVKHPSVKGRLREIAIKNLIEPFLPPSVAVITGTIVHPNGSREYQMQDDVVLFSKEKAPLLLSMLEQNIIPLRGVKAHIEVKSTLTKNDIKKAIQNAVELRDLAEGNTAPVGIIFAYASDLTNKTEVERLLETLKEANFTGTTGQASCPIQMICIANRETWVLIDPPDGKGPGWYSVDTKDDRHLLAFVSIISNFAYKSDDPQKESNPGIGAYLLDVAWLKGPNPKRPLIIQ